jgi:Ran-binding protein 9/10
MSDIYFVESNADSDSGTPVGSSGEYYLLASHPDQPSKEDVKNPQAGSGVALHSEHSSSSVLPAIPSYLQTTAYGERFRAFSNSSFEGSNDVAIASKFNLPQMFPSRTAAELDAVGMWRHYGNDESSGGGGATGVGVASGGGLGAANGSGSGPSSSHLSSTSQNGTGSSVPASSSRRVSNTPPANFLSVAPLIQSFGHWMDKANISNRGADGSPFLSRKELGLAPLPGRWVKSDHNNDLAAISTNGYEVSFEYDSKLAVHDTITVRTDRPIPPLCGIYYFEVEITSQGSGDFLGIGLCDEDVTLTKVPGLDHKSWGYHSDDGRITACQGTAKQYGPKFGPGDVIGCAINFKKNSVFYTKNGLPLPTAFQDVKGTLYPCIGMKKGISVYANFGQNEFRFDIEKYIKDQKKRVLNTVSVHHVEGLFNPNREMTDFIKDLVSQYFNHEGFLETAKAFKKEREREEKALVDEPVVDGGSSSNGSSYEMDISDPPHAEEINDKASIDVQNRYRIRKLVLAGDIDGALKFLNVFYPQVLENDSLILFKLRCRKFIELIRKSIPGSVDVEMVDAVASSSSADEASNNGGSNSNPLTTAIEYGQQLRQDYKSDERPFVVEHLTNVFSLLAYEDPSTSREFSHLLDHEELVPLAEELNSTLLASQGKPSVPALQKVAQQAIQLTWELSDQGYSAANLISVDKDFLDVRSE